MRKSIRLLAVILIVAAASCHPKPPTTQPPPTPSQPPTSESHQDQILIGLAAFYSQDFTGRMTSSGEKYNPNGYTAAHRSLPFGTRVRVTSLDNNRSVVVIINDRGPHRADRIIDLSFAAARDLQMVGSGVAKVQLEILAN
jgi:peptidoglycan lytic transglycosylase